MINEQYKYSELTSKIIGCAMAIHKALGNGFQRVIYQHALAIEMKFTEEKSEKAFSKLLLQEGFPHHLGVTITRKPKEV